LSIDIQKARLVLFDRDGTLTVPASGATFPKSVDDQQWMPGRLERLRELRAQGVYTAIVTNQGGAAWGIFTPEEMLEVLGKQCKEGRINTVFVCFHDTSEKAQQRAKIKALTGDEGYRGYTALYKGHHRRKPSPGMLLEAMDHFGVGSEETLMVGDRPEDEKSAQAAGCRFVWAWEYFGDAPPIA
jgi:D-glycero-D-manno-heptose 1,7-bisphosphate phosphatase